MEERRRREVALGEGQRARGDGEGAAPVERAWAAWRGAITADRPDEKGERQAVAALAQLVWEPFRKELPADLQTVYLTADGVLHQVPWAALPGSKPGTVLLDEYAVCLVPHGPFLLERLEEAAPGAAPGGTLLAVGGVDYDGAPEAAAEIGGLALEADVADERALSAAFARAAGEFGGLDVVVANAGTAAQLPILGGDPTVFERTIEVNLLGVYYTLRAAAAHIAHRRGYALAISRAGSYRVVYASVAGPTVTIA